MTHLAHLTSFFLDLLLQKRSAHCDTKLISEQRLEKLAMSCSTDLRVRKDGTDADTANKELKHGGCECIDIVLFVPDVMLSFDLDRKQ
jgi:hypothetical protein